MGRSGVSPGENMEVECPGCGLAARDWPHRKMEGFISPQGDFFCCKDCFEGHICGCGGSRSEGKVYDHQRFHSDQLFSDKPKKGHAK